MSNEQIRYNIDSKLAEIQQIVIVPCREFGVKRLDIFGSTVRGTAKTESDLDFIVWFIDPHSQGISRRFFGLLHALEDRFQQPIDLLTEKSLQNPYLAATINLSRVQVYGD